MKITSGKVVSLHYVLTNTSGEELDKSAPQQPLVYLHGQGQIIPGLEKQLEGLSKGDKRDKLEIAPAEAYGEFHAELKASLDRKQFPENMEIQPGMQFMSQSPSGQRQVFVVTGVQGEKVEVDGNHPLAGQTLNFKIEVADVREATEEELAHGHAHGPGGHNH